LPAPSGSPYINVDVGTDSVFSPRERAAVTYATLILLGTAPKLNAKAGCSNATLQGTYAVHATGTVLSGPTTGPIAFIGAFT